MSVEEGAAVAPEVHVLGKEAFDSFDVENAKLEIPAPITLEPPGEHPHEHYSSRANWLRAMVLGANDGLVSTAALMMGVGGGSSDKHTLLLAGLSSLVAGALSMAVGEYISVSSQKDAEQADIAKEMAEQAKGPESQRRELMELAYIYKERGCPDHLAMQVAVALSQQDVIRAHARDELGIDIDTLADPSQAAIASFFAFVGGSSIPLAFATIGASPLERLWIIVAATTVGLLFFGALGAFLGGAKKVRAASRVLVGGWLAMAATYGIGKGFGASAGA